MKLFLTLLISCFYFVVIAQVPEPTMLWLKGFSGNSNIAPLVTPQIDGGFIIAISANISGGNIDSFCSLNSDRTIFLKYNSDATVLEWSKCYHNSFADSGFGCMFLTPDGGFILGGIGNGTTHEFLIHKENATGMTLWSKTYGDGAEAILESMIATKDGGYIMVGEISYTDTDFTIHYGSWADPDIAVLKVDSNGNKVWSKVIGGSLGANGTTIISAPGNGCYIVGTTSSNDYDCTGNHGGDDVYVVRLDSNGNIVWHDDIGGSGGDQGNYAFTDDKGGVIIAGASNSLDGDRTVFPSYGCPVWALEVDSNKHIIWNNCFGGGGSNCYPNAVCKSTDGSIWIAGVSTLKGGQVDTAYGKDDALFIHIDSGGNFINAKVLGSDLSDRGMMVYPLSNGNVIVGGFYDTAGGTFSKIIWYNGSDAFLTIFAPWSTGVSKIKILKNIIEVYPNPSTDEIIISAKQIGNYDVIITNVLGEEIYKSNLIDKIKVKVKEWRKTIYYVEVINEDGNKEIQKLIVQ